VAFQFYYTLHSTHKRQRKKEDFIFFLWRQPLYRIHLLIHLLVRFFFHWFFSYHKSTLDSQQSMYGVPVKFADDLFSTVCT